MPEQTDAPQEPTAYEQQEGIHHGDVAVIDTPDPSSPGEPGSEPESFPREYVVKLREENAKYRQRAGDRDTLAHRLHRQLVAASGRLADPDDLAFDEEHLTDETALISAIDDLLARKPHLASRRPSGDIGQGAVRTGEAVDLAGMLRRNAS